MKKYTIIILLSLVAIGACSHQITHDMIGMVWTRSGDPDSRFAQSMDRDSNCGHTLPATIVAPSDDYDVYLITDSHLNLTHRNLDVFLDEFQKASSSDDIPLILHLGDLIDASEEANFADARKWLDKVWDKIFITPGNHDLYFNQWHKFLDTCGCGSYYIEVQCPSGAKDMFLCMDSSAGTLGKKQKTWLEDTLKAASERNYRNISVFTHTHFFHNDHTQFPTSNFRLEETYELSRLFEKYGVKTVLSGHDHTAEYNRFGGIDYHVVGAIKDGTKDPSYAVLRVSDEGVSLERKAIL